MNTKKILTYAGIAFVVFFILAQPGNAGNVVQNGLDGLRSAANSFAAFVTSIAS